MNPLKKLSGWLEKLEGVVISLALLFMIGLAFLQVILRNFWDTGISWGDPVVRALVIWVGFIGASIATHQKSHIQLDIVAKFLPKRAKKIAAVFAHLASAVICALLAYASYKFMLSEKEFGEMLTESIPNWWVILIIPVSFTIMGLRFLLYTFEDLAGLFRAAPEAKTEAAEARL